VKLPNADKAYVPEEKVRGYLLSPDHAIGRFKARFFEGLGFTADHWEELRSRLLDLAQEQAELGPATEYGQKYYVFGRLQGPTGARDVVSVWIVLVGDDIPRLVTVYPR